MSKEKPGGGHIWAGKGGYKNARVIVLHFIRKCNKFQISGGTGGGKGESTPALQHLSLGASGKGPSSPNLQHPSAKQQLPAGPTAAAWGGPIAQRADTKLSLSADPGSF